ncbi:PYRD [Symbiodinium sp. KB8]|nr:PYRD [Symbiodinium sp. KB8]
MPTFQGAVAVFGAAYHFAVQDLRGTAPYWWLANAAMPLVHLLDAETAHVAGVQAAARGWAPIDSDDDPPELATEWLGMTLGNPIGLAAGFDKGGEAVDGMLGMGFGAVEVGSVTPEPQPGNAKPRVFRLAEDGAVVNRYGFNSEGLDTVQGRVVSYMRRRSDNPAALRRLGPVGVNVGKNKDGDAVEDFTRGVRTMAPYADYVVVNVSSPNTPGLRSLQRQEQLQQLVTACVQARDGLPWGTSLQRDPPPLLVKVAPDLSDAEIDDICAVALSTGIDGLIVSNTTVARPVYLRSPARAETGGLSGAPLFRPSTEVLKKVYARVGHALPIVGVGGVSSGEDAFEKIRAGASLVQLYSSVSLGGPQVLRDIKTDLAQLLRKGGFASVQEAVGVDVQRKPLPAPTAPETRA